MKIAIIGWYGTETIGDRAILGSLIKMFSDCTQDMIILLGSIYPFFTERTILEDKKFIEQYCNKKIKIEIFDSRNHFVLKDTIKKVDCIVVGGGPLMDLSWLFMIEYAFMKAKKYGKKTAVLGCGIGPLYKRQYIMSVKNILKYSDLIIFRDSVSLKNAKKLIPVHKEGNILIDPAVFIISYYAQRYKTINKNQYIAINLRKFPMNYALDNTREKEALINSKIHNLLLKILETEEKINLIPMHYFGIGDDDRAYLNNLKYAIRDQSNVYVQNLPLSLEKTMDIFMKAKYCFGMRFHSVVMQTILNGRNYIIDYTEPHNGKISGFLNAIGGEDFYQKSYINLQDSEERDLVISDNRFIVDFDKIKEYEQQYKFLIKEYLVN